MQAGRPYSLLLIVTGTAFLLTTFESSAVVTVLPAISRSLHIGPSAAQWPVSVYLIGITALLPHAGELGDFYGYRKLFLAGLFLALTGTAFCAASTSPIQLCTSRIIEAAGIVLTSANGTALVVKHSPVLSRSYHLGLLSTAAYTGLVGGTVLSGWLTSYFGWHSIFVVVSTGFGLLLLLAAACLPADEHFKTTNSPNVGGSIVLLLSLAGMETALDHAHGDWHLIGNWGPLLASFLLFAAAISRRPFAPLRSLFNIQVTIASLAALLIYTCLYSIILLLPFYLLENRLTPLASMGLLLAFRPVLTAVTAPFGGRLADRFGQDRLMLLGLTCLFAAFLAGTMIRTGWHGLLAPLALSGLGMGLFLPANHSLILGQAMIGIRSRAAAVVALTRNLACSLASA